MSPLVFIALTLLTMALWRQILALVVAGSVLLMVLGLVFLGVIASGSNWH